MTRIAAQKSKSLRVQPYSSCKPCGPRLARVCPPQGSQRRAPCCCLCLPHEVHRGSLNAMRALLHPAPAHLHPTPGRSGGMRWLMACTARRDTSHTHDRTLFKPRRSTITKLCVIGSTYLDRCYLVPLLARASPGTGHELALGMMTIPSKPTSQSRNPKIEVERRRSIEKRRRRIPIGDARPERTRIVSIQGSITEASVGQ